MNRWRLTGCDSSWEMIFELNEKSILSLQVFNFSVLEGLGTSISKYVSYPDFDDTDVVGGTGAECLDKRNR